MEMSRALCQAARGAPGSEEKRSSGEGKSGNEVAATDDATITRLHKIEVVIIYELSDVAKATRGEEEKSQPGPRKFRRVRVAGHPGERQEDPSRIEVLSSHDIPDDEPNSVDGERISVPVRHGKLRNLYERVKCQMHRLGCVRKSHDDANRLWEALFCLRLILADIFDIFSSHLGLFCFQQIQLVVNYPQLIAFNSSFIRE